MRTRNPVQPGRRLGMSIEAWPALDRTAWNAAFAVASPLDDHPHGAELRAPTRVAIGTCYARWPVWLKANHPDTLVLPPGARATQERVIAYLQTLHGELALRTLLGYACRLKRALQLLAPEEDWSWFTPIIRRIERRARAARSASHPFVPSDQLFNHGIDVMAEAEADHIVTATVRAEEYRNGLMIAFLAARPLRLKNMTELEIGTS